MLVILRDHVKLVSPELREQTRNIFLNMDGDASFGVDEHSPFEGVHHSEYVLLKPLSVRGKSNQVHDSRS